MPNTKSAKKALRQTEARTQKNKNKKRSYKTAIHDFRKLVAGKDLEGAQKLLPSVYKTLDKAAKGNVIKTNKASRLKSRLTIALSKKAS